MEQMKMHSPNFTDSNIEKLAALFPNCVTEATDKDGSIKRAIDFDLLKQELSENLVEGEQERYHLNWPGKRQALLTANAPIAKTLRPCREDSVDFDTTENLFIEGDNLDALKLLQETYLGKVKMIYIDPPYNTGKDFLYSDNLISPQEHYLIESGQMDTAQNKLIANPDSNGRFHSDWLTMVYSRLKLARTLLTDDGIIFISIDDNEQANLKRCCDEIFSEHNFVANFLWEKRTTRENRKVVSNRHDHVLCFCKSKAETKRALGLLPMSEEALARYKNPDNDPRGVWTSVQAIAQAGHGTKSQFYTLTTPDGRKIDPPSGSCWRYTADKMNEAIQDNRIWFGAKGTGVPRIKKFLTEGQQGLTVESIWWANDAGTNDSGKKELVKLFNGKAVFDTPKPVELLKQMLRIGATSDSLILDFFAGSAPMAEAVFQLNYEDKGTRKFILVQIPEGCSENSEAFKAGYKNIAEICKERIRRAGKKLSANTPLLTNQIDTGFRVLKIDSSNMEDVYYSPDTLQQDLLDIAASNVKVGRTEEDLLFQVLLDWGVDLSLPITSKEIEGNTVYFVDENALAACFTTGGKLTDDFVKKLTKELPMRVVFRDAGFKNDSVKINAEQIFKLMSPHTEVKTI